MTAQAFSTQFSIDFSNSKWPRRAVRFLWGINVVLLLTVLVRPATSEVHIARYLYHEYPEGFTLYAPARNAYQFAFLETKFYQRPHKVKVIKWQEPLLPMTYPEGTILYMEKTDLPSPPAYESMIYTDRPDWLKYFNWKNWQERTAWWWVYEL